MQESDHMDESKQNDENNKKVEVKDRVCEYYITARGCVKGDKCDFKHPKSPNGSATSRVCDFYNQPRGCIKGEQCDFLHVRPRGFQQSFAVGRGRGVPIFPSAPIRFPTAIARGDEKTCKFFLSPRGCIKGEKCDFMHSSPLAPPFQSAYFDSSPALYPYDQPYQQPYRPPYSDPFQAQRRQPVRMLKQKVCEFHNTPRGCVKGDQCDFIHQKDQPCDFFDTPRGCRKGDLCDFKHTTTDPKRAKSQDSTSDGSVGSRNNRRQQRTQDRFHPYQ